MAQWVKLWRATQASPIRMPVQVLVARLPVCLLVNVPGKAAGNSAAAPPAAHTGEQCGVRPSPALCVTAMWRANKWMEDICPSLCFLHK